jgi:hypothetical protein
VFFSAGFTGCSKTWELGMIKFQTPFSLVLRILLLALNPKSLTFQAGFIMVAYFRVAFGTDFDPQNGHLPIKFLFSLKTCEKTSGPDFLLAHSVVLSIFKKLLLKFNLIIGKNTDLRQCPLLIAIRLK